MGAAWWGLAACRGARPEPFFTVDPGQAKAICAGCGVRQECAEYALADPKLRGVWGGSTYAERKSARQRLGLR